jgi:hypothetical protein
MLARRFGSAFVAILCAFALGSIAASADTKKKDEEKKPAAEKPAAPADTPPPPGHKFAKITVGMSDAEVRSILGEPNDASGHITGKAFIPYYYGSDTSRVEWLYKGSGIIQFSSNRWSGRLKVIRVIYDPTR